MTYLYVTLLVVAYWLAMFAVAVETGRLLARGRCPCGKTEFVIAAEGRRRPHLRLVQGEAEDSPKPPRETESSGPR